MYIDWTYIVLVLPAVIFSLAMSALVNSSFKKYSSVLSYRGVTAADAARRVLESNGVSGVTFERVAGNLTDHYDPRTNVIRLSDGVYSSTSVAAIGVACHEAGHAVQYVKGYAPIKFRAAIIPITNIGSKLSIPLIILGIALSYIGEIFTMIAYIGVALYGLCVLFQLATLPTEFNASRRALESIKSCNILSADELVGAKKVLSAAAMTYVAALAVTLMQFLRLLIIVSGSSRRNRR